MISIFNRLLRKIEMKISRLNHDPSRGVVKHLLIAITLVVGCERSTSVEQTSANGYEPDLLSTSWQKQYASVSEIELSQLFRTTKRPILVEYGVNFNCTRCEQMMPIMNELAKRFEGHAHIVRASFNPSSVAQAKLGLTLCPSYLFYHQGKLLDRCDGPTALPVLKSKLSLLVSKDVSAGVSDSPMFKPVWSTP